ncbi:MAG: hypothetical protein K5770_20420, partial [Lachnospiraceae bacterium]|nr:hypothetical protein [Lachnospiraceae bacterium]
MENWKTSKIILFTITCISLNICGKLLSVYLELPIWADSFGTALSACIGGPVCGAVIGFTSNIAYFTVNHLSAAYSITSIALGVIIGIAAKRKWFYQFYGFMIASSLAVFTALIVSIPVNILFSGGYTGNKWGDGLIDYLLDKDWVPFICYVFGQLAIEFADKLLTIAAVFIVINIRRMNGNSGGSSDGNSDGSNDVAKAETNNGAAVVGLFLCLSLCLGLSTTVKGEAQPVTETTDYNDYVQNIYSSNNGLPCGEANDIAQTNDGVLWIGTYAGLYRYNGREFRWVDNYESVKNVNCLYVDEEGRLWIGTNDNGLSIVIREKVVNVLDQSSGLPSNSVRCIIRATDGYYYVGTTGSMQILAMNNGLKAASTLNEIYYAESITADEEGHVAVVASDGRLFLLKGGEIQNSIKLPGDEEIFKCCDFAPDGTLMVGTTTNHIYRYDVSGDDFKELKGMTCERVNSINNLHYLDDGTLFIST